MIQSTSDTASPQKVGNMLFATAKDPSGHHSEGGEKEFYQDLDDGPPGGIFVPQIADKRGNKLKEMVAAAG
jgi:hypothetical protein